MKFPIISHNRRQFLGGGGSVAFLPVAASAMKSRRPLRISLLGQALIKTDIRAMGWQHAAIFRKLLRGQDAVFTDLETAIAGPLAGQSTRPANSEVLHVGDPSVIDCLTSLGVNLFATSNNHAWDLNTGGILSTIQALDERGLSYAGTGRNLAAASRPALLKGRGTVALVAAASGAIRDGAAATMTRPGVNELVRGLDGALTPSDVDRYLAAIRVAASTGATVIAYLHNHHWEQRKSDTPTWQRTLAKAAIDAGACTFVAHGVPELQGIEYYKSAPLFHGLSSFIFQTEKADDAYGPEAWQSLIAHLEVENGKVFRANIRPVQLDYEGLAYQGRRVRGSPMVATGTQARTILEQVKVLSARLGDSVSFKSIGVPHQKDILLSIMEN
ncbi:CapA family protein [Sphingorhabdus sp.]|uniref:CapA family protein n=1 Tax=Sphingorhabdus sp. TaxID=1902408 RepID=UPI00391AC263